MMEAREFPEMPFFPVVRLWEHPSSPRLQPTKSELVEVGAGTIVSSVTQARWEVLEVEACSPPTDPLGTSSSQVDDPMTNPPGTAKILSLDIVKAGPPTTIC